MYDVNYDEYEPVDQSDGGTYSTARPARKRHVGFAIAVSLLVVILCAVMTVISLFSIRIERDAGSTSLIFTERNPDISAAQPMQAPPAAPETDAAAPEEPTVEIRYHEGDAMPMQEIYRKLEPSVVSVISTVPGDNRERCGVIMSKDGYIITNSRIGQDPGAITVLLSDGAEYTASLVGTDPLSDLAVVKIEADSLTPAEFGDSGQLEVGDQVLSIGDPSGRELRGVMTDGIISGLDRDLDVEGRTMTILQTNACLPSGGYGGPLINMRGQVVGISVESIGSYAGTDGSLGLAVPIDNAKSIVDELIEHGYIPGRPSIGITGQSVTAAAQTYYNLPAGVYVENVETGGAAQAAGIRNGDIITAIEGVSVTSPEEMNLIKNRYKSGDTVILSVYRDSESFNVSLILDEARK